jgi:signal transduction histidine kinase
MILADAASLLTTPPGSLVYHLTLIISLSILFALTWSSSPQSDALAARWRMTTGVILGLHLLTMIIAGLSWLVILNGQVLLPPLDRFVSFTSLLLISFTLIFNPPTEKNSRILAVILSLATLALLGTVYLLVEQENLLRFNRTLADAVWGISTLILSVITLVFLMVRRPAQWQIAFAGYTLLTVGYSLHMTLGPADSSFAPFVRWSELVAFPVLIIAAVRTFITIAKDAPQVASQPPDLDLPFLPKVFTSVYDIFLAKELGDLADAAVRGTAYSLKAEICLLLTPPEDLEYLSIATGFDLIREQHIEGQAFDTTDLPVIANALHRRRSLILPAESRAPDLVTLQRGLNLHKTGPMLFAPLTSGEHIFGGLLLLSPFARQRWSQENRSALVELADGIAERFGALSADDEPLTTSLVEPFTLGSDLEESRRIIQNLLANNTQLTNQLIAATDLAGQELGEFLSSHQDAEGTIHFLEGEIERMRTAIEEQPAASGLGQIELLSQQLQLTLHELAEARANLAIIQNGNDSFVPSSARSPSISHIAALSVDLRQPMSAILGYSKLLQEEAKEVLTPSQRDFIDHIYINAKRLAELQNDLIHLSAIEAQTLNLVPTPIDIVRCIKDAIRQVFPSARKKNIEMRVKLPHDLPKILTDADATFQVMIHLLNNAIGATPEGGLIKISTSLSASEKSGFLTLQVIDGGTGIPAGDLGRIFSFGNSLEERPIQGIGGDGIGLSIARSLVEAMSGRIWVDSQPGSGTTFSVLLPFSTQDPAIFKTTE